MTSFRGLVLAAIAATLIACAPAPAPVAKPAAPDTTAEDLRAIRAAGNLWFDAFKSGDAGSVAAFYSQDAILMPANSQYVVGRHAIREQWAAELAANRAAGVKLEMDETDAGVSGTIAWRTGTFLGTGPDGQKQGSGKFLQVWQKSRDGLWQITHGMYNFDEPRAPVAKSR